MSITIDSFKLTIDGKDAIKKLKNYQYHKEQDYSVYDCITDRYWVYRGDIEMDEVLKDLSLKNPNKVVRMFVKTDHDRNEWGEKWFNGKKRKLKKTWN